MSLVAELITYCHVSSGEAPWGRSGHLGRPKSKKVSGNARSPIFFVLKHKFFGPRVSRHIRACVLAFRLYRSRSRAATSSMFLALATLITEGCFPQPQARSTRREHGNQKPWMLLSVSICNPRTCQTLFYSRISKTPTCIVQCERAAVTPCLGVPSGTLDANCKDKNENTSAQQCVFQPGHDNTRRSTHRSGVASKPS